MRNTPSVVDPLSVGHLPRSSRGVYSMQGNDSEVESTIFRDAPRKYAVDLKVRTCARVRAILCKG